MSGVAIGRSGRTTLHLFLLVAWTVRPVIAQPFVDIEAGLTGVRNCSLAWGDFDNDNDPDLAISGQVSVSPFVLATRIYRNNGNDVFTDVGAPMTGVTNCSLAWADYDKDTYLDLAVAGESDPFNGVPLTRLYRNVDSGGVRTLTGSGVSLLGLRNCSLTWVDFNKDTWPDLVISGLYDEFEVPVTKLYKNVPNSPSGRTFVEIPSTPALPGMEYCSLTWGDFDGDTDPDLAMAGLQNGAATTTSKVYRNDGDNGAGGWNFTEITVSPAPGLTGVSFGAISWGDYNNDGALDLALSGRDSSLNPVSKIYRNGGTAGIDNWYFYDINASLPAVQQSTLAWGDLENDGHRDLALAGLTASGRLSRVYRYDGNDTFSDVSSNPSPMLVGINIGAISWGDYDGDNDLDLALAGFNGSGMVSRIYRNEGDCGNPLLDSDGDGVTDCYDACEGTPPGVPVDPGTGCIPIPADFNGDYLVTYIDYFILENCASGPSIPMEPGCEGPDLDDDNDVDQEDFARFQRCFVFDNTLADPHCAE